MHLSPSLSLSYFNVISRVIACICVGVWTITRARSSWCLVFVVHCFCFMSSSPFCFQLNFYHHVKLERFGNSTVICYTVTMTSGSFKKLLLWLLVYYLVFFLLYLKFIIALIKVLCVVCVCIFVIISFSFSLLIWRPFTWLRLKLD